MRKPVVFMVVGDVGGVEALAPVIPLVQQFAEIKVFADPQGAGKDKLAKLNIAHEVVESINTSPADLVVCGTNGKAQQLQRQATINAEAVRTRVMWVSDFYQSGCEPGVRTVRPGIMTFIDTFAQRMAFETRPDLHESIKHGRLKTHVTGNPAFDELATFRKERDEIRKHVREELGMHPDAKLLVFGGSATRIKSEDPFSYDDMTNLVRLFVLNRGDKKNRLLFSFHPADPNRDKLETMARNFAGNECLFREDIRMYAAADAVIVQYSTIGVKSTLLGVPTLFTILPSMRNRLRRKGQVWPFFPQIGAGAAEVAWSEEEICPALDRMLSTNEPDYHEAHITAVNENFSQLIDGNAAERVKEVIYRDLCYRGYC